MKAFESHSAISIDNDDACVDEVNDTVEANSPYRVARKTGTRTGSNVEKKVHMDAIAKDSQVKQLSKHMTYPYKASISNAFICVLSIPTNCSCLLWRTLLSRAKNKRAIEGS